MHVFLYEFVTGGGWYSYGDEPCPDSLMREGRAMAESLAADLCQVENLQVTLLQDQQIEPLSSASAQVIPVETRFQELAAFKRFAADADWTIVIAPEISGFLAQRAAIVEKSGGRLLGPGLEAIRLTSDKHALAESLIAAGIAAPQGIPLERHTELPSDFHLPAVCKPRDGAGSLEIRLIRSRFDFEKLEQPTRLEEYCLGTAASVAFLCGPEGNYPLVPCEQHLSDDGRFTYLGGSLPLSPPLAKRAVAIAARAVATLGPLHGMLGVDLVLGESGTGEQDTVIEINPRPTTSYVGLRALAAGNLAEAMLNVADGREPSITWSEKKLQFDSQGRVTQL
jgi:predicted ATP-grasp superfamily ATP-dependent carboligase